MLQLAGLDTRLREHAERTVEYARQLGVAPVVTSTRRSASEQARLYANWKAGLNKYPVAPVGQSAHQYGVAWDSVVPPEQQALWNAVRRAFGWYVPEGDLVHAEFPNWTAYRAVLAYS